MDKPSVEYCGKDLLCDRQLNVLPGLKRKWGNNFYSKQFNFFNLIKTMSYSIELAIPKILNHFKIKIQLKVEDNLFW